jgi:hypothetical protein
MANQDREKSSVPWSKKTRHEGRKELDELRRELGDNIPPELLEHLEDLQKVADAGIDFDDPQAVEAALRRLEYERIEREFQPRVPLYGISLRRGDEVRSKDDKLKKTPTQQDQSERERRRRSYQDDPRYREFYERLRKNQTKDTSHYDEPPQFSSLEELDQTGWDGTPRPWEQKRPARPLAPSNATPLNVAPAAPPVKEEETDLIPGVILRFDDGSVAIYKDAVSGKDYALFYFLEPQGALVPQGIFLDQYDWERLGLLPPDLFDAMIRMRRWDRDAVIYHLDRFEYAGHIRAISTAQPMQVEGGQSSVQSPSFETRRPSERPAPQRTEAFTPRPSSVQPEPTYAPESEPSYAPQVPEETELPPPPPPRNPLERGRVIRINVGPGKVWEAVYWTSDELGPILAHDTNREWSLIHMDISRFKDAIEYGELLSEEELEEIEQSLARQRGN